MKTPAMRRIYLRYTWDRLQVNFWFVPAIMALAAILLVVVMHWVDSQYDENILANFRMIVSGEASELRSFMLGMAVTILTTTGIVFTLLTLPLSTVAAQYGSRLLRVFLSDRTIQLVLGQFVATFIYCFVAAVSIQPNDPDVSITFTIGILLMLVAVGCLILLIQHISKMLQAPFIAAIAGAELLKVVQKHISSVESRFEQKDPIDQHTQIDRGESEGYPVQVQQAGYIQYIDPEYILMVAQTQNLVIHLLCKPGQFLWQGMTFAMIWPPERVNRDIEKEILKAMQIGNQRTPTQDIEYAVDQLVEMAVRAISPSNNDPFTTMTCLDYLGQGLAHLARVEDDQAISLDQNNQIRLLFKVISFPELVDTAFEMLRHSSRNNATVLVHMLNVIDQIGRDAPLPQKRHVLLHQVKLIVAESQDSNLIEADQQGVCQRAEEVEQRLLASLPEFSAASAGSS